MTPPDSELISRTLVDDDSDAFAELVHRHQSMVRNFLRHLANGNAALADDLAQETFIRAFRGLERFRGDAAFSTWLLGIAHNQFRNASRLKQPVATAPSELPEGEPVEPGVWTSDLRHDMDAAIQRLPTEERIALHLHYRQGLSHSETAAVLDCPIGTVKTNLARAKEKLRTLLAVWNPQT